MVFIVVVVESSCWNLELSREHDNNSQWQWSMSVVIENIGGKESLSFDRMSWLKQQTLLHQYLKLLGQTLSCSSLPTHVGGQNNP